MNDSEKSMAHEMWRRRLDKMPTGAPDHVVINKLLSLYCTAEEAEFLSRMPAKFCSLSELCEYYGMDTAKMQTMLNTLIDKYLVGDVQFEAGISLYTPLQIIPGCLGYGSKTQDFRVMVREEVLPDEYTEILDYERATEIIKSASRIAVGMCTCSSMKKEAGIDICDRPLETCMSLNAGADNLLRMNQAREISKEEALKIIENCKDHNMIQCADNVVDQPWYMCNCCKCCCGLFEAVRKYNLKNTVVSSNFVAYTDDETCVNCGECVSVCFVDCIGQRESHSAVDEKTCLGCGICVNFCQQGAKKLKQRKKRIYTPREFNEKFLTMALERGKLGDQLFFDVHKRSHTFFAILINTVLKLPPVKQLLAIEKLKSRFLQSLVKGVLKDMEKSISKEKKRIT